MHAYFLESTLWNTFKIDGAEFNHMVKVMRIKQNEEFLLFDGEGRKALCSVEEISKKSLLFKIIEEYVVEENSNKVILAAAWTKAARRGFLFEKVVELEASELWLWYADYSQFPLPSEDSETVSSWNTQLISGVKQCLNPFLPKLRLFKSQKQMLEKAKEYNQLHVLTTDPAPNTVAYTAEYLSPQGTTVLVIGSEGGFSSKEIELFSDYNAQFYTLGERILRYETAAILALGLHFWHKNNV